MIIGVLSAMEKEHKQLVTLLHNAHTEQQGRYTFTIGQIERISTNTNSTNLTNNSCDSCSQKERNQAPQNTLILMTCGIGKVNAAVGATTLIHHYRPDCIISTGCAGGIDPDLQVMDVVASTQVAYHDVTIPGCEHGQIQGLPARFRAEEQLLEAIEDNSVKRGLICSGDQFISDHSQLQAIKKQFPEALAVDMESAAIAQTCYLHAVPFLSFRILSDTPGADEHLAQYFDFWDRMADHSFETTRRFLTSLPTQFAQLRFAD